jgi:hypothetical protein
MRGQALRRQVERSGEHQQAVLRGVLRAFSDTGVSAS